MGRRRRTFKLARVKPPRTSVGFSLGKQSRQVNSSRPAKESARLGNCKNYETKGLRPLLFLVMGNMPVVDVGGKKVRVKRLLSEGGYAHVYKVSRQGSPPLRVTLVFGSKQLGSPVGQMKSSRLSTRPSS